MKRMNIFFVILLSALFSFELYSQSIPQTINFQGVLKDASGNIVSNGDYNVTFKIYNAETGGTELWTETKLVNVVDGIFSTQLGTVTPITLPFDAAYWLGITVGSGSELTPRVPFSSVPYSRMSLSVPDNSLTASKIHSGQIVKSLNGLKDDVNLVAGSNVTITPSGNDLTISASGGGGGTVTQINTGAGLTGGPITTTGTISVANDGITTAMLQNNSVTSSKIADGTITATDIANSQVVKSINNLKDNVNLVAGSNITITPSGQNLTISSTSGGIGGSGTTNYIPLFTGSSTLGSSVLYQSGSKIGIGTTTPDYSLTINANPTAGLGLKISRAGGFGMAFIEEGQPVDEKGWEFDVYQKKFSINTTHDNGYSEIKKLMTFDRNGNVGIGNSNPQAKVDILGGNWDLLNTEGDFKIGNETIRLKIGVPTDGAGAGNNTIVSQGGQNRLILGAGNSWDEFNTLTIYKKNVGIGTTSPEYPLHISTNRRYAGYFTSDSLSPSTHVLHSEYTGIGNSDAKAVYGISVPADYYGYGGYFVGGYKGVHGSVFPTGSANYTGVDGYVSGGSGTNYGVYGRASGSGTNYGVYGRASGSGTNWAGYFNGDVNVTGTISKGGGSFKIDHPLDPQNKYLYHSFVESPDMKNIYDGTVITDASGYATVTLPEWFEALNKDFRYQLTVIGDFAQAIVAQEIQNNQFTIRTDKPNVKVSWQVTGIRHDPFAEKYRIPVEEYKKGDDVGKYLYPEAFGLPETMGIDYKHIAREKERGK
ncbi:hypothetical protein [Ignavibacterium sp.]|uniref:hypothetical protein n=1 Tax=Ignavibacterium sp. TaxID=2651167 RepID=UPI00220EAAEC|nr:hypothetical protein [Ignavibacterium sp.]BDQ03413.1 MAG: hypothetical protein KatS3mg037_1988 [Ignavibacterium sp.]